MTQTQIIEELNELAEDYGIDAEGTVKKIDNFLTAQGFEMCGGEMQLVDKWERGSKSIIVSWEPEKNRVGISDG